ncbi:hypothetical protein [Aliiglaciecola sp. LCG003]|uniref:hypothetical protein n=1 Tax=Aliiglaciecola sp. LCG003 TaxID=3053655 RepID=UPI0025723E95|nr:hypothetical protein [Aliiglaciecola sp. LCG003]WJG10009.1 hypothetical protein QR722_02930 [Aliiglaciecola sp. LCG003]
MAENELQSRLEYLVSYSSQLIFISSDSISKQKASLQLFISQQHENTEIAYLNADSSWNDSDFKREICRQLGLQYSDSATSLGELLRSQLSPQSGPILICIFPAEHMSVNCIQELWELVQSNKVEQQNRHINVLLFGASDWALEAKSVLSKNNSGTPILLSSDLIKATQTDSELDTLIAKNRLLFSQRIVDRKALQPSYGAPLIKSRWFKYLAATLFVILFLSILFWQYPREFYEFLDPNFNYTDSQSSNVTASASIPNHSLSQDAPPIISKSQNQNVPPIMTPMINGFAIKKSKEPSSISPFLSKAEEKVSAIEKDNMGVTINDKQQTVTDWQTEISKISEASRKREQQQDNDSPAAPIEPITVNMNVEAQIEVASAVTHPLMELDNERFALQLAAMSDLEDAQRYISNNNLADLVWLYTTKRFGGDWHVIVDRKTFETLQQARDYALDLPAGMNSAQPFAKSIKQIKEELALINE